MKFSTYLFACGIVCACLGSVNLAMADSATSDTTSTTTAAQTTAPAQPAAAPAAPATAAAAAPVKSADAATDPNAIVCREMAPMTGTRIGTRRICKPQKDWDAEERYDQSEVNKAEMRGRTLDSGK